MQGDHETGGLTIENPDDEDESGEELSREDGPFTVEGTDLQVFADWTTGQHTGADTPITASGPGSEASTASSTTPTSTTRSRTR